MKTFVVGISVFLIVFLVSLGARAADVSCDVPTAKRSFIRLPLGTWEIRHTDSNGVTVEGRSHIAPLFGNKYVVLVPTSSPSDRSFENVSAWTVGAEFVALVRFDIGGKWLGKYLRGKSSSQFSLDDGDGHYEFRWIEEVGPHDFEVNTVPILANVGVTDHSGAILVGEPGTTFTGAYVSHPSKPSKIFWAVNAQSRTHGQTVTVTMGLGESIQHLYFPSPRFPPGKPGQGYCSYFYYDFTMEKDMHRKTFLIVDTENHSSAQIGGG